MLPQVFELMSISLNALQGESGSVLSHAGLQEVDGVGSVIVFDGGLHEGSVTNN